MTTAAASYRILRAAEAANVASGTVKPVGPTEPVRPSIRARPVKKMYNGLLPVLLTMGEEVELLPVLIARGSGKTEPKLRDPAQKSGICALMTQEVNGSWRFMGFGI